MSDYLRTIVERFDPIEHRLPSEEELEAALPDQSDPEEIIERHQSLRSQREGGGAILTSHILNELFNLSVPVRDAIEEVAETRPHEWTREQKDDVHLFFAFVGQVQEYLLRVAVVKHVISDEATTEAIKAKIVSDKDGRPMPVSECLDYLHSGGTIDDGLKGEIAQTRDERNETVHDIWRWFYTQHDPTALEAQVSRAERSVVRLLELVFDFDLE
jgi:hypothetical protein